MKILKGCTLVLLSILLFFSLCILGITYTVDQVALSPRTIEKVLNAIDFSQAIQETMDKPSSKTSMSPELQTALIATFRKMEPVIKEHIGVALDETYAYLKGQGDVPDMKAILGKSVMTSEFVSDLLDKIDLSQLLDDTVKQQIGTSTDNTDAFANALVNAIDQSEPLIKQQIVAASDSIFKYLLMQTDNIDLKATLRQTILSNTTVNQMLSTIDYSTMTKNILTDYIGEQLPQDITLSSAQIDRVVTALQPAVKTALSGASGNFADYLTGISPNFNVNIPLATVMPTLKTVVREAYMAQLPANVRGLSPYIIDSAFEQYYTDFSQTIPASYEANSDEIGISANTNITKALNDVQSSLANTRDHIDSANKDFGDNLKEVKTYVGYFRTGFMCLIALIIVLILGIALLCRNVKDACRNLGIIFSVYGALALAVVILARMFALHPLAKALHLSSRQDTIQAFINIPKLLLDGITSPLQIVSLVCLISGIVLIIVSIVYPKLKPAKTAQETPPATS